MAKIERSDTDVDGHVGAYSMLVPNVGAGVHFFELD